MNQSYPHTDEDQDSLFGSPPPSPARGRSPSQETFTIGDQVGPVIALPSTGVVTKNVGTIALPGSHMSCAELPADLPASSLSLPRPTSSHHSPCIAPPTIAGTSVHSPVVSSCSPPRSVSSRASSAASTIPSTSTSTRKRRTPKAKSLTPAPPPPPIALPGPNEPTPPNFLRSQSSLLGLAGLVGSVKPAQLYTHPSQPIPVQQHSPIRGSTPTHPIVLDDDQDAPHIGEQPCAQIQMPHRLDQLNPEILRSNILNSLTQEKNIFPVLESLIKLLGGEPLFTPSNPPSQSFARPYGHGIFNAQYPPPVAPPSATSSSTTPTAPPPKRRKLKHVPAGAVDWDIPFPFAAGEGPERYRDTWARDRAKQLATQLLELVQNAAKRAAIKTAKSRGNLPEGRTRAQNRQSSRSASVETRIRQTSSTRANIRESASPGPEGSMTATPNNVTPEDSLCHFLGSLESPSTVGLLTPGSKDRMSVDSEGVVEEGSSAVPCDYSAFEEWLSQLQQFVPLETDTPTPESDWGTRSPVPLDSLASHTIRDEAIDPTLLAISQLGGSVPRSQSPTSPTPTLPDDIPQVPDMSTLTHSPRTSLSSLTEPLTPLSEAFADAPTSTIAHQDLDRSMHFHRLAARGCAYKILLLDTPVDQPVEKDHHSRALLTEPCITRAQKGKVRADTPSTSSRSTPSAVSTSKGVLDKHAILERARERRRQLVAEIERAKVELWETSIENAVWVHLTRDGSL